jgi:predicted dehydrogenase
METVRVGVIGIGNMGGTHADNLFAGKIKNARLCAVCDIDTAKLDDAKRKFNGIPTFEDYKELIGSGLCDAVIIATPHYFHPVIAVYAFSKGLNVLTEKPAGVYTAAVEQMCEAAMASGKVFAIMYNQRTTPIFAAARDIVRSGRLGELKRSIWIITNWYRNQAYYDSGSWRATWAGEGGGVLLNQCVHNIDLWQWIIGMPSAIRGFCAYGKYHNIEVEDDVSVYAEYDNGATGVFVTSTGEYPGTNRLEISGDRGKMVLENGRLKFWELASSEREFCFNSDTNTPKPEITLHEPDYSSKGTAHCGILQNFVNAVLNGEELISPGYDGMNALQIINAIHLSDWTGETVRLPVDKEKFKALLDQKIAASSLRKVKEAGPRSEKDTLSDRWSVKW